MMDGAERDDRGMGESRRRVLSWAVASRMLLLALMVLSDALLPDHNPGPGVMTIDNNNNDCYCPKGYACDTVQRPYDTTCADLDSNASPLQPTKSSDNRPLSRFYSILLSPLTKWDAARFISIAAYPRQRLPLTCSANINDNHDVGVCIKNPWEASEKAHAFFPLCPQLFAMLALRLNNHPATLPRQYLPPTFVGTTTLAALLVNTLAFLLATLALHDLTYSKTRSIHCAELTSVFFVINPASVFFTAAYSESIFAALLFLGHAQAARARWHHATFWWMAASYCRSNGSWMAVWLLLHALASLSRHYQGVAAAHRTQQTTTTTTATPTTSRWKHSSSSSSIGMAILHTVMAVLVVLPMIYHDQQGKMLHCSNTATTTGSSMPLQPDWCDTTMSLYGHVQRTHWNVGMFRYYEWKQLPNFLLAAPILVYGIAGVVSWIHNSWNSVVHTSQPSVSIMSILQWAVDALANSQGNHDNNNNNNNIPWRGRVAAAQQQPQLPPPPLLLAPSMLADYAMLAMTCILGLTVAHVQISTRLICSSCPAIYWYMAHLYATQESRTTTTAAAAAARTVWRSSWLASRQAVVTYCVTYIVLGVLLHVNWLPWT